MIFQTPPLPIVDSPAAATHHTRGRGGHLPRYIVIHHTGGTNSLAWLRSTSPNRVSAHRLITKAGVNHKIVGDTDTSHAAGYAIVGPIDPDTNDPPGVASNFNVISLNIELENLGTGSDPYPMDQMVMCARQCVEWIGKYGYLAIVGHSWVDARKQDPLGFDWTLLYRLIDRERVKLVQPVNVPSDFKDHLRAAGMASQTVVSELTAMLASLEGF
jgi:N-acetyl-anhydromuramyl-L-alanine amidase AmpD